MFSFFIIFLAHLSLVSNMTENIKTHILVHLNMGQIPHLIILYRNEGDVLELVMGFLWIFFLIFFSFGNSIWEDIETYFPVHWNICKYLTLKILLKIISILRN